MRYFRRPTNTDNWEPEVAIPGTVTITNNQVTITNIRNFSYQTRTDFAPHYETRTYDLADLSSLDLILSYWTSPLIAHVFLSFGFNEEYMAISIEIRRRKNQKFSSFAGFFRQYEMFYVVADERDLIGQRVLIRKEAVYLYRVQIPEDIRRKLFLSYLHRVQHLAEKPEFYNTLTNNCTTNIFRHANETARLLPFNWKILFSGRADEYAYQRGILDQSLPFETLKRNSLITPESAARPGNFSHNIRSP
jgi:hypothetical protein